MLSLISHGYQIKWKLVTAFKYKAQFPIIRLMVEMDGKKVKDVLTSSNPWSGKDLGRVQCLHCDTNECTHKKKHRDCIDCEVKAKKGWKENPEEKHQTVQICGKKYTLQDRIKTTSYMMKHIMQEHEELDNHTNIRCGMRVLQYTRTIFERQILDSVQIQEQRKGHILLNSRSEYIGVRYQG